MRSTTTGPRRGDGGADASGVALDVAGVTPEQRILVVVGRPVDHGDGDRTALLVAGDVPALAQAAPSSEPS